MEKNHLMNSLLFDSWKRAGLSEKEAKQAAMESARSDVAMSMVNQSLTRLESHVNTSMAELRTHVDTSMTALRGEMTELRAHVDTSHANLRADIIKNANSNSRSDLMIILGAIAVATAVITLF